MVKQGQTVTSVRDRQTKMELPGAALLGETGLERASGWSVLSWHLEEGAGLKVITALCTQGNWGPEMEPS